MKSFFDPDSKLFSLLTKLVLLIELNLCVLAGCLPVVTAGASLCAMHAVLLKIYREEDKRVSADFLRAVKTNLKNATGVWLLYLGYLGVLAGLGLAANRILGDSAVYAVFGLLLAGALGGVYLDWALILLSRYDYTVSQALKYALLAWMKYPGSTVIYLISLVVPAVLCLSVKILPLLVMMGITLPHLISTTLYSTVFDEMEGIAPRLHNL